MAGLGISCSRRDFLPRNISRVWIWIAFVNVHANYTLPRKRTTNKQREKRSKGERHRLLRESYVTSRIERNVATLHFVRSRARAMPPSQFPRTYDHFYLMHCCQFAARYCHDLGKLAHVSKTVTQKRLEDLYEERRDRQRRRQS